MVQTMSSHLMSIILSITCSQKIESEYTISKFLQSTFLSSKIDWCLSGERKSTNHVFGSTVKISLILN
jgi:hypothetical protein